MDRAAVSKLSSSSKFIQSSNNFEFDIKERLKWNKSQWSSVGESGNRYNKLCNSLQFWKKKLKPAVESVSIVFTLFNPEKDVRVELYNIVSIIENLDASFIVKGFADFRNPRYLCLYFESKEIKDRVKEKFRMIDDSFVVYLSWALEGADSEHTLNVHWLPMTINIEEIRKALNKYVTCIKEERKNLKFLSGRVMPSGKLSFKVALKKDVLVESIPHVMEIVNMEALITVSGRKPLCLNCDVLGHISRDCKLRFCDSCRTLKAKGHVCESFADLPSYADKVKLGGGKGRELEPDDWGAEILLNSEKKSSSDTQSLAIKILDLENKIKFNEAAVAFQTRSRMEHERKADELGSKEEDEQEEDISFSQSMEGDGDVSNEDEASKEKIVINDDLNLSRSMDAEDSVKNENKKKKENKKKEKVAKSSVELNITTLEHSNKKEMQTRSYGRPVMNNPRKLRENKKSEKLLETQEFRFQD